MIVFYRIEPSAVDWDSVKKVEDPVAGELVREMLSASPGFYTTDREPSDEDKMILDALGFQIHILGSEEAVAEIGADHATS